jgi:hypothetical protein
MVEKMAPWMTRPPFEHDVPDDRVDPDYYPNEGMGLQDER